MFLYVKAARQKLDQTRKRFSKEKSNAENAKEELLGP